MKITSLQTQVLTELSAKTSTITRKIDMNLGAIHGIGFAEYMVLSHLMEAPNHLMRRIDLATALDRSASGVTKMLSPMEKIGLVSRDTNPRDARVSLVKITPAGETVFKQALKTLNQQAENLFKKLDSSNLDHLLHLLHEIDRA
ncbi:MAG: MarR family winged helix-turn-helix transcriptional regulator [Arenicella sp.]